jgi:hypothetical protein
VRQKPVGLGFNLTGDRIVRTCGRGLVNNGTCLATSQRLSLAEQAQVSVKRAASSAWRIPDAVCIVRDDNHGVIDERSDVWQQVGQRWETKS